MVKLRKSARAKMFGLLFKHAAQPVRVFSDFENQKTSNSETFSRQRFRISKSENFRPGSVFGFRFPKIRPALIFGLET
jgi:hypothetical protein